ncbi:MAG: putative rRNA processing protein [Rhizobiaceae bacterium]|jgi:16S rRNA processing protein RimM|nr:putative rRNA processing protein [Rhizobiaceae bacterium]
MPKLHSPILMAVIGAPHGISGEVRVKPFTAEPLALSSYGPLFAADGRSFEIIAVRPQGAVVIARLKGVADRSAAAALTGTELFVDRAALPPATEEGEFYHADLVGLEVRDDTGTAVGAVTAVQNYGGGDILELALQGRGSVLVPFTSAAVPEIDIAAGLIRIDPLAAGLLEDERGDEVPEERPEPAGRGRRRLAGRPRGPRDTGGNR